MASTTEGSERKTDRLEAFSDAVLAIAITLPVVELKAPDTPPGGDLAADFAGLGSHYAAYGLSWAVIGLYWGYSHFSGKIIRKTDHGYNLLTLLFLAAVSLTPFPTRAFVEHLNDPANSQVAALVYSGVLTAPTILWSARWGYAIWRGLLDPRLAADYVASVTRRYAGTTIVSVLGMALVAIGPWKIGMGIIALATLSYLLPPMTPRYKPGEEPASELSEADEQD